MDDDDEPSEELAPSPEEEKEMVESIDAAHANETIKSKGRAPSQKSSPSKAPATIASTS